MADKLIISKLFVFQHYAFFDKHDSIANQFDLSSSGCSFFLR